MPKSQTIFVKISDEAVTIRYEWERGLRTVENQRQVTPDHSLFKNSTKKRIKH